LHLALGGFCHCHDLAALPNNPLRAAQHTTKEIAMIRIALALLVFALAGCSGHKLTECQGHVFQLNDGKWQATAEDLQ
jgi:hypothetical protein